MNTRKTDEYIKRLKRRANHLEGRVGNPEDTGRDYDRAELMALSWAIRYVEDTYEGAVDHQAEWFKDIS